MMNIELIIIKKQKHLQVARVLMINESYSEILHRAGKWQGISRGILIGFVIGTLSGFGWGVAFVKWKYFVKTNDSILEIYQEIYNYLPKK